MALRFPDDPQIGEIYAHYTWDGEKWVCLGSPGIPIFSRYQDGLVPAPGAGADIDDVLRADATWAPLPSGGGGGGGGGRTLLNVLTLAVALPTVQDTQSFTPEYDDYEIVCRAIGCVNAAAVLAMQFRTGTTFQTSNYYSAYTATAGLSIGSTGSLFLGEMGSNLASGTIRLYNINSSTPKNAEGRFGQYYPDSTLSAIYGGGSWNGTEALTGVRFHASSGTLRAGTDIRIYGLS